MRNKKLIFAFALLFLLHASFTYLAKQDLNIVFIGDSITHGTGPKDQSPPIFAGQHLRESDKFGTVNINNQGVSGFTTVDFLPATHKSYPKVRAAADGFAGKAGKLVFSIMLGTNDSAIKGPTGAPVAPSDYRGNLKVIADSLLAAYPKCMIVINYPIWYSPNTQNRGAAYLEEGLARVNSYYPEIDALVKEYRKSRPGKVFVGDTKGVALFKENYLKLLKPEVGPVGNGTFYLHPNKDGDIALGNLWADAIAKAAK